MPVERTGVKVFASDADEEDVIIDSGSDDVISSSKVKTYMVKTPSGSSVPLMTQSEVDTYEELAERYQKDNLFKNIADLMELDKLLTLEMMIVRWSNWILRGEDYYGEPINASEIQKNLREYSKATIEIKSSLAIEKKHRDAAMGGTIAGYIENLKRRAKEMGVHRDKQNYEAFNILMDIRSRITLHKNSTPTERTEFEMHAAQILDWIQSLFPKFDELDEHFRENQKIWLVDELNQGMNL